MAKILIEVAADWAAVIQALVAQTSDMDSIPSDSCCIFSLITITWIIFFSRALICSNVLNNTFAIKKN